MEIIREATSEEMKKNIRTVRKMTGGMGFDENMGSVNWKMVRRISSIGYRFMPKEKGVKFSKVELCGHKVLLSESGVPDDRNIIIYIHGGGFVSGAALSSKGYSSMLAKYSGQRVFSLDYSLSPEHKYPDAVNDCYAEYQEIRNRYPNAKISLVGESAGGNLCLALALKVEDKSSISAVIVHSPFVDFTGSLDRSEHEVDDFTVKEGCLTPLKAIYVGEADPKDPLISPLFGDYKDFPPTFITCDYNETLYADAKALYNKCEASGVEVHMVVMKGTFHAFATIGTGTPETMQILKENMNFIKSVL
ncbi:MAG: alpha/beta hydrolase [Clostridiales bacterium]|nr:alpha/beta hydrolase [Clostridiales bacterium]